MARAFIAYDKDLPEIPGRRPWEKPTSFLVKDEAAATGWSADTSGRRPSRLMLVPKIRTAVDAWRDGGYAGASAVTRRLFEYWFAEEHAIGGFSVPFRYHFCQREAIETLAWLIEIAEVSDVQALAQAYATTFPTDAFSGGIDYGTKLIDGTPQRVLRRYVPELDRDGEQDLPPDDLRRFAFKMATGSGKTWVMAMAIVWSRFHKQRVPGSELSTNFLIVAPNVIVYQRLERDFAANRIFEELPLIPPEWRASFNQKVILRGETAEPDPSGNLVLTNVQQLYESRDAEWTPANAVDAILGPKPAKDPAASGRRSLLERLKSLPDLVVVNDEAHHVHDDDLAWNRSLLALDAALPAGMSLWLDFSATPRVGSSGPYFAWTVCDYPLAQAVEDRIVKAPLIVTKEDDPKQPKDDPTGITKDNVGEKYGYWIRAAVQRWRAHRDAYEKVGVRPVLFVMAEKNVYADAIGAYIWKTREFGIDEAEVLVIHTDADGELKKKDLDAAREAARDIDKPGSRIKVIVSVLMLREGWDVRNVTVVLGLRAYESDILAEQVIGRGLRLMGGISPDRTQTLEVLGTRNLLNVLRKQLEVEGIGTTAANNDPPSPVTIYPVQERLAYDIAIPITKPSLQHSVRRLADLDVPSLEAVYEQRDLAEIHRIKLRQEFGTIGTEVGTVDIAATDLPAAQDLLASITNKTIDRAKLPARFAELYPAVREYVATRCFGKAVDLDDEGVRSHLARLEIQEGIAGYLARTIAGLTIERRALEFAQADFQLSQTSPFSWRRNLLPKPLEATKTVFNIVATYNDFERRFALFLDKAADVVRFASLGTTEQGDSGTQFRVDYLKPSGAIGFYHPDWVVVQETPAGEVNWIIETKGRVWEDTAAKDEAIRAWCDRVTAATGAAWRYARVDQSVFGPSGAAALADLVPA